MGSHPINLALRFFLELAALAALGFWGWHTNGESNGWLRFLLAVGIPMVAAVLWGTFAVPDDPSRSGKAPVAVPGFVRLAIEAALFVFAVWALYDAGYPGAGFIFGIVTGLHYIVSYDRILWLLRHNGKQ